MSELKTPTAKLSALQKALLWFLLTEARAARSDRFGENGHNELQMLHVLVNQVERGNMPGRGFNPTMPQFRTRRDETTGRVNRAAVQSAVSRSLRRLIARGFVRSERLRDWADFVPLGQSYALTAAGWNAAELLFPLPKGKTVKDR